MCFFLRKECFQIFLFALQVNFDLWICESWNCVLFAFFWLFVGLVSSGNLGVVWGCDVFNFFFIFFLLLVFGWCTYCCRWCLNLFWSVEMYSWWAGQHLRLFVKVFVFFLFFSLWFWVCFVKTAKHVVLLNFWMISICFCVMGLIVLTYNGVFACEMVFGLLKVL